MLKVKFYFNVLIGPLVSEEYKHMTTSIDNLMFKNKEKMDNLRHITKVKKLEVRNARKFIRNYASSIRNKVVTSIDKNEGNSGKSKFHDKGERIKYKSKTNSVLTRT